MRAIVAIRRADANAALPLGAHARHPARRPLCSVHASRAPSPRTANFGFNQPQTLIVAILVRFVRRWLNRRFAVLRRGNIPEAVTGGVVASLAFGACCPRFKPRLLSSSPAETSGIRDLARELGGRPEAAFRATRCRRRHVRGIRAGPAGDLRIPPGAQHRFRTMRKNRLPGIPFAGNCAIVAADGAGLPVTGRPASACSLYVLRNNS